jgi:hypothetical protein
MTKLLLICTLLLAPLPALASTACDRMVSAAVASHFGDPNIGTVLWRIRQECEAAGAQATLQAESQPQPPVYHCTDGLTPGDVVCQPE